MPDKIKDGVYVINLGVEHIPGEVNKFINIKNIIANIFRIHAYDSVMCGYFCIGFITYMFMGISLTDYTNLLSPNNFKKNAGIILNYFLNKF